MADLQVRLDYANKRVKFAWAKYYEAVRGALHWDIIVYNRVVSVADDREIPEHIKKEMKDMAKELKKKWECPVCLEMISDDELEITNCGHYYCGECLRAWKKTCRDKGDIKWKCSICNREHKYE